MYYYFYSDVARAISISGAFLGVTSLEPKKCNITTKNAFIEAVSLENPKDDYHFVLDDKLLSYPPSGLIITDLRGGYLLHFKSFKCTTEFKVIAQEKMQDAIVTVFCDNGVRISIETTCDFFATTIYENVLSAQIKRLNDSRLVLVSFELENEFRILIFELNKKIKKLYDKKVTSFTLDKELKTTVVFSDIKKHAITTTLDYCSGDIKEINVEISAKKDLKHDKIINELIPYVFLEDFLVGDNYQDFLSSEIRQKSDCLKTYLGEFRAVIPPPLFRDSNEIGLVYKKTEQQYYVDYFTFTVENNLISNLKKLDY